AKQKEALDNRVVTAIGRFDRIWKLANDSCHSRSEPQEGAAKILCRTRPNEAHSTNQMNCPRKVVFTRPEENAEAAISRKKACLRSLDGKRPVLLIIRVIKIFDFFHHDETPSAERPPNARHEPCASAHRLMPLFGWLYKLSNYPTPGPSAVALGDESV